MTTLSKEDTEKLWWQSNQDIFIFAVLARADLVAENGRLKEMAMFFSTYTDPDELEIDEIENAARESFRRSNSGARGTTITRANSYESHVIWATKARISKALAATRTALAEMEKQRDYWIADRNALQFADDEKIAELSTALAAAEAREMKLREALDNHSGNYKLSKAECATVNALLDAPRDDSALREMIAGVYDECANVPDNVPIRVGNAGIWGVDVKNAIRALAEKAKWE